MPAFLAVEVRSFAGSELSLLSARSRWSLPDSDSGHPGEEVCFQSMCHLDRIILLCRRRLLSQPCYSAFRCYAEELSH